MNTTQTENTETAVRLPLWKNTVEALRHQGVTYGTVITSDWFEEQLRCARDTMEFTLAISEIRRELEYDGLFLNGRGQEGKRFIIVQPRNNRDVMASYQLKAADALRRAVTLGSNTDVSLLNDEDRRKHESALERAQIKSVLMKRANAVSKLVQKHAPKLIENP